MRQDAPFPPALKICGSIGPAIVYSERVEMSRVHVQTTGVSTIILLGVISQVIIIMCGFNLEMIYMTV